MGSYSRLKMGSCEMKLRIGRLFVEINNLILP